MAQLLAKRSPTPGKSLGRPSAKAPAKVAEALALLEHEIGGREALVAALSHAPKSRDFQYLLGIIGDPREDLTPLADLCSQGGVTVGELLQAYTAGEINRAGALSTAKVGQRLAEVAADTMRRALPEEQTCQTCQGTGSVTPDPSKADPSPIPGPCRACGATGRLVIEGDLEHKKLALDMGKLLQKGGGGMNLNINQQVGVQVDSAGGALERLQLATDAILYGDADSVGADSVGAVIDAEPVQDPLPPPEAAVVESPPVIEACGAIEEGDWHEDLHD